MSKYHPEIESAYPLQKMNWIIALNIILIIGIILFAIIYALHTSPPHTNAPSNETQNIPVVSNPEDVQGMQKTPLHWEISISVPKQIMYGSQ